MFNREYTPHPGLPHPDLPLTPEDLFQLEMLLGEWVVDLGAVTQLVAHDIGFQAYVLQLAHDLGEERASRSIHECIVEIGVEGLLHILHNARLRRRAN
jgi:hypothetical protein